MSDNNHKSVFDKMEPSKQSNGGSTQLLSKLTPAQLEYFALLMRKYHELYGSRYSSNEQEVPKTWEDMRVIEVFNKLMKKVSDGNLEELRKVLDEDIERVSEHSRIKQDPTGLHKV